jgi:hypothetical protein
MGNSEVDDTAFENWLDLMIEYQANYFYLIGKEDELEFKNAKLGQGMSEYIEFLKEDISAGLGIPLNFLFGRSVSGGIGGEGALTAERNYMQTIANVQKSISDDVLRIVSDCGFNVDGLRLSWNLALQKTSEQRKREKMMDLQNEILEEQLKQMRTQTEMQEQQKAELAQNAAMLESLEKKGKIEGEEYLTDFYQTDSLSHKNYYHELSHLQKLNTERIQYLKEIGVWKEYE